MIFSFLPYVQFTTTPTELPSSSHHIRRLCEFAPTDQPPVASWFPVQHITASHAPDANESTAKSIDVLVNGYTEFNDAVTTNVIPFAPAVIQFTVNAVLTVFGCTAKHNPAAIGRRQRSGG